MNAFPLFRRKIEPLAAPVPGHWIAREIERLPAESTLARASEFTVLVAEARQIPATLCEIGRLRELTFREVGEGTGRSFDLDRFDDSYRHLFLWNHREGELAGAYRLALADEALATRGPEGLYTATLFRFDRPFLAALGKAIELGRSFVRPEYQRKPASLLMLWKGIGAYVARHPEYRVLFGPVSISRDYGRDASEVMVRYLRRNRGIRLPQGRIQPRHPFRGPILRGPMLRRMAASLGGIDDLDRAIARISSKSGMPVLLRHYLQLGGRILEVNVDPSFSGVLDALIVVDLARTETKLLDRYMGREHAAAFRGIHGNAPAEAA